MPWITMILCFVAGCWITSGVFISFVAEDWTTDHDFPGSDEWWRKAGRGICRILKGPLSLLGC